MLLLIVVSVPGSTRTRVFVKILAENYQCVNRELHCKII